MVQSVTRKLEEKSLIESSPTLKKQFAIKLGALGEDALGEAARTPSVLPIQANTFVPVT
jgi:hypothetical protein